MHGGCTPERPSSPWLTWFISTSPILLMRKFFSLLSTRDSFFRSRILWKNWLWMLISSSKHGNSFSTICCSKRRSVIIPRLYTSLMILSVRTWCSSVCISSAGGTKLRDQEGSATRILLPRSPAAMKNPIQSYSFWKPNLNLKTGSIAVFPLKYSHLLFPPFFRDQPQRFWITSLFSDFQTGLHWNWNLSQFPCSYFLEISLVSSP